jgi:hypothetical protein
LEQIARQHGHGALDKAAPSIQLPPVDLRALMLASVSVSPLYLWFLVDSVSEAVGAGEPLSWIIFGQSLYVIDLLINVVSTVAIALGSALIIQRRGVRPLSFMITSLLVFVAVVVLSFGLTSLNGTLPRWESFGANAQYEIVVSVLSHSCAFVAVALAARLYVHWRQAVIDTLDARRFAVLGAVAIALAAVAALDLTISVLFDLDPLRLMMLTVQQFLGSLIESVGTVLLFGSIAIAAIRRAGVEDKPLWVMAAGLSTAFAYWLTRHVAPMVPQLEYVDDTEFDALLTAFAVGLCGGAFYFAAINRDLVRDGVAAVRSGIANPSDTIRTLRNWPYRPTEDKEP